MRDRCPGRQQTRSLASFGHGALAALLVAVAPAGAQPPGLNANVAESAEGYYQLTWQADEPVRLIEARDAGFADARVLYTGEDTARVISGKPDGRWHYRLESAATGRLIGMPIAVTVAHHPLGRAIAFFAVGATVFAATLGLIVVGSRKALV